MGGSERATCTSTEPVYLGSGQGNVDYDPEALGLDADGDGIFHFTTVILLEKTGQQRQYTGIFTGTYETATATISTNFPTGHTKGYATANWSPWSIPEGLYSGVSSAYAVPAASRNCGSQDFILLISASRRRA